MRRRLTVAALLVAALVFTGCGRDDNEDTGGQAAQGISSGPATGTITVWAMGTEGEKLSVLAKDFEAANPGVKVNVTAVPWDSAHDKISTAIAAKTTPDVSMIGTTWMGEFAKTGALDQTPTDFDKSAFFPGAWDTTVVDGTSYGVPWYVETRLIYYRTDLAAKAGVQPPTNQQQLKEFATALQQKGGAQWGINLQPGDTGSWQTFLPFVWQLGGDVTDASGNWTLDSPQMTQALEYYKSFFTAKLAPGALQPGELESMFVAGKIGAFVSGPWHIGILKEQGGAGFEQKFDVAHMPKEQAGTSFVGGSDLAVFKESKNRDSAWKFVQYLTRPEVQVKWYQTVSDLPSVQSAWSDPALSGDKFLSKFGDQLKDAKSPPAIPTWEQVAAVIDDEVEKATIGNTPPAEAVKAMQKQATSIGTGS
ncbi:MAG: sugar ABC transporter substrate-binding protein [Micromonosporaceae bacterium]|nr:sugar ABC transporter substrate-binding protein [Micromonosporaceae bacterium]